MPHSHSLTLRLLVGRMAIPSFHSSTWTMLQAPPTCAVRVGVVVLMVPSPLQGSATAAPAVTSTLWWPGSGAEEGETPLQLSFSYFVAQAHKTEMCHRVDQVGAVASHRMTLHICYFQSMLNILETQ